MSKQVNKDVDTETALLVVEQEKLLESSPQIQHEERERLIAHTHQMIGQIKAADMFGKFANVSSLVWLQQVKESKIYRGLPGLGTWEDFCKYIGLSRQKIDLDLQNLATFGEEFLLTVSGLSVGYRDLRKLRQLTNSGEVVIDAESIVIGGEQIPLTPDHKEDLQAAIERVIEEKDAVLAVAQTELRIKKKEMESQRDLIRKQERSLSKLEKDAASKGITANEDVFLTRLNNSRTVFDGNMLQVDPLRMEDLKDEADPPTPRMIAAYLSELGYRRSQLNTAFDTAYEMFAITGMSPEEEWAPGKGELIQLPE